MKRREEEAKQQAEIDAVKKALKTFQVSSDTEEDSQKKPVHSARQVRLVGGHSRSLFKKFNEMISGSKPQEVKKLGEKIYKAYRATGAENMGDDSATTVGKAFARYSGGSGCYIPIIWDTGCSKSIISEEAVKALGSQINDWIDH